MMSLDALLPSLSSSYSARLSAGEGDQHAPHPPPSPSTPSTYQSLSSTPLDGRNRTRPTRYGLDADRSVPVHPDDMMRFQVVSRESPASSQSASGREELTALYRSELLGVSGAPSTRLSLHSPSPRRTSPSHPTSPGGRPVTTSSSSRLLHPLHPLPVSPSPSHLQLPHPLSPAPPSHPSPHLHPSARPSSTRPALTPLSFSSSSSRPSRAHRSSLGASVPLHHLPHLSEQAQRSIVKQSSLLSSPAGLKLSLTPSLSSTPLPCSPSSKLPLSSRAVDQENAHPNLIAQLTHSLASLDITQSQAEKHTRQALSPSLHSLGLVKPSARLSTSSSLSSTVLHTPLPSRSSRPVKRLSYGSAHPSLSESTELPLALPATPAPSPPSALTLPSVPSPATTTTTISTGTATTSINPVPFHTPRVALPSTAPRSALQTSHVRKMR